MKNLKEILDDYNHSVEFPIMGQTLVISAERNIYNAIRHKYNQFADDSLQKFKGYLFQMKNLDELLSSAPDAFVLALEKGLDELSKDAISIGYYSLDTENIIGECVNSGYFDDFQNAYENYITNNEQILSRLSNSMQYRQVRKQSRPRWVSATYGGDIFDAWGGRLKTSTMNVVEGAGHSIVNAIGNAIDESNAEDERKALFKNKKYQNILLNSVWKCAANLRLVITNIISKRYDLSLSGWITNDDSSKARSMFNNVMRIDLDSELQKKFVLNVIELNPYVYDYYSGFMKKYLDHGKEFLDIADFFHVHGLREDIRNILAEFAGNWKINTCDDFIECRDSVYKCAAKLKVDSEYLDLAMAKINECGSRILCNFANNNLGTTEEDAQNCRKQISKMAEKIQLDESSSASGFKIVDDRINKLDLEYRTVEGVVLNTREEADKARNDVKSYSEILEHPGDFKFKWEFIEHINKIKSLPIDSQLIENYAKKYQGKMESFDRLCKKASHHEYRTSHGNFPLWNGDVVSMGLQYIVMAYFVIDAIVLFNKSDIGEAIFALLILIAFAIYFFVFKTKKEKNIYDNLTQNGQYPLSVVTSEHKPNEPQIIINTHHCPKCNAEISLNAAFCKECGTNLSEEQFKP